jgi:hypothetical protein
LIKLESGKIEYDQPVAGAEPVLNATAASVM